MAKFTKDMGGKGILDALRAEIARLGGELAVMAGRDELPREYRAGVMRDTVTAAREMKREAERAFNEWAAEEQADARGRYHASRPVGSAAEETRRLADETRLSRLVETGRATDARLGPVVVDGGGGTRRLSQSRSALEYAERATGEYLDGNYVEAQIYARASMDLGGPPSAATTLRIAQDQLDLADPQKAEALKDLSRVALGAQLFTRDIETGVVGLYRDAAKLAQAVGDTAAIREFGGEAGKASLRAKAAEIARAASAGDDYVEPSGALPGGPTGVVEPTTGDYERATSRLAPTR